MLLLKEAVSDNSAECNDEMEEDVSSVMAERNGVLSDEFDDGETPLDDPFIMTGLLTGIVDVVSELPTSDDFVIPCRFFKCFVLSPLKIQDEYDS